MPGRLVMQSQITNTLKATVISSFLFFPGGSEVKASASNVGDPGSIPGLGRSPGEGNGNPLQYSCCKESDTTEQLHLLTYLVNHYCLIREMMEFRFHLQGTERL